MKKGPRFGTDIHKPDATACMVIGCDRRALYRGCNSKRGYCSTHRSLAVAQWSESSVEGAVDYHMGRFRATSNDIEQ